MLDGDRACPDDFHTPAQPVPADPSTAKGERDEIETKRFVAPISIKCDACHNVTPPAELLIWDGRVVCVDCYEHLPDPPERHYREAARDRDRLILWLAREWLKAEEAGEYFRQNWDAEERKLAAHYARAYAQVLDRVLFPAKWDTSALGGDFRPEDGTMRDGNIGPEFDFPDDPLPADPVLADPVSDRRRWTITKTSGMGAIAGSTVVGPDTEPVQVVPLTRLQAAEAERDEANRQLAGLREQRRSPTRCQREATECQAAEHRLDAAIERLDKIASHEGFCNPPSCPLCKVAEVIEFLRSGGADA